MTNNIVYKISLPLEVDKPFRYHVRKGFMSLHVAAQYGLPHLWFQVPTDTKETVEVQFIKVGTGFTVESDYWHLGTIIDGAFVWHYYAKYINE